ncbi:MAG TPA: purine-nucleoside phosphorylase [Vicinamibacteria bacterium]|nr:purine-nucleoside phosphorylase [Vicinamibacteria bacterium]
MSALVSQLDEAAAFVRSRTTLSPTVGVVLGSGLGAFADALQPATAIPFADIPHFPASTVAGHGGTLVLGRCGGVAVVAMKGRVHFYEGYTLSQVVFPVRVLARLGARTLLVTNAAGGVNTLFAPGDLMVIEDHINFLGNPLLGPNEEALGPRFPDLSDAYDRRLGERALEACAAVGVRGHHGVYLAMQGPSYETPAEIRMARVLGADAVGMSTVPEVIAARHAGMRVAALSCVTNLAAGVSPRKLDHAEVLATGARVASALVQVLTRLVAAAAEEVRP